MKQKIFITGVSSIIMKKLCEQIDYSKFEVIGLSRNPKSVLINTIKIVKGNINTISTFSKYIKECDIIIHAAALTHSYKKENYYTTNLEATKNIVNVAKEFSSKKIIYISSNTANEKSGAYGHSKLLSENYIINNYENWQIIRISEVFGIFKEGIDKLIKDAVNKNMLFCPTGMPFKFSPIHINDLSIELHKQIFEEPQSNKIININGNEKYSFKEIINIIKKHKKINVIYFNKKMMFLILKVINLIPFNIGLIPDQIERLYGFKSYSDSPIKINTTLNNYIIKILKSK